MNGMRIGQELNVIGTGTGRSMNPNTRYFAYLNALRESGAINMFGAAPHLAAAFSLSNSQARDILLKWMESYK
jgi:hypothetical protein